jgi:low temperature requirement protein LtrA
MTLETKTVALRGIVAALVGAAVNAGLVALATAAGIAPGFQALTYPPVVFLSVVGALGAAVAYLVIQRRASGDPDRAFTRIAAIVLVLSFVPDIGLLFGDDAATVAGVVLLMVMHVVVAVAAVTLLTGRPIALGGADDSNPMAR